MRLKGFIDVDHTNYKKLSMFLALPDCTFKCCNECGVNVCQNSALAKDKEVFMTKEEICESYLANPLTEAIVLGGLEPFDSDLDIISFIDCLRRQYGCKDDVVIYTGYTEEELLTGWRDTDKLKNDMRADMFKMLLKQKNIIIKYGRFVPDDESHFDEVLGVKLASSNQYAKAY